MKGRKPYPVTMMDATNDRQHLTRDALRKREQNEPKIKSNQLKMPGIPKR